MKIAEVAIHTYELPLAVPLQLTGRRITSRRGVVIRITDSDGAVAYGEAAPLDGFHRESIDDALGQLINVKDDLVGMDVCGGFFELAIEVSRRLPLLYPSVRMAIEMAMFDLGLKSSAGHLEQTPQLIPVNALLMSDSSESVDDLVADGFVSIKIKVGGAVGDEIDRVLKMKEAVAGRATLRLDANRAWQLNEAVEFAKAVGADNIEYIEEPTKSSVDHKAFYYQTGMGLALDETIVEEGVKSYPDFAHVAALILKPSLLGGFSLTALLMDLAKRSGTTAVISSSFESGLGISSLALFAASMNLANTPAGLDTLKFFERDLTVSPLRIDRGAVRLSQAFGCIYDIDEKLLRGTDA